MASDPLPIVSATALTYTSLLAGSQWLHLDYNTASKAVSSFHSVISSVASVYALSRPWKIQAKAAPGTPTSYLDDSTNPLIFGYSRLGNAITSCETGYLLYETIRKVSRQLQTVPKDKAQNAFLLALRKEPLMMTHHFSLLLALGILQVYISKERERGIWIIVAFEIMNASTPFLHLRWRARKRTGKDDYRLDLLLALAFVATRLGTILWIVKRYAAFHGMDLLDAFSRQRLICKAGTAGLFVMNAAWLVSLLYKSATAALQRPGLKAS